MTRIASLQAPGDFGLPAGTRPSPGPLRPAFHPTVLHEHRLVPNPGGHSPPPPSPCHARFCYKSNQTLKWDSPPPSPQDRGVGTFRDDLGDFENLAQILVVNVGKLRRRERERLANSMQLGCGSRTLIYSSRSRGVKVAQDPKPLLPSSLLRETHRSLGPSLYLATRKLEMGESSHLPSFVRFH